MVEHLPRMYKALAESLQKKDRGVQGGSGRILEEGREGRLREDIL